jgi:SSS family solute:Na+ symporter
MNYQLNTLDFIVFLVYFVLILSYGFYIYKKRQTKEHDSKAFFLAEGSLTWWAIGASLIASNISAEQFIGMSGNGFFVGIAVSAYEWIAALSLVIIAIWFMPIYLKNKIYTMPQFLQVRYNETVSLIMAIFWLFLYVFVNLTSILYLGSIAINGLLPGQNHLHEIMICLAIFAVFITLGGMKVIGYTDVIQVTVLIVGGLATTYMALAMVSEKFGVGGGIVEGFKTLMQQAPEHFHMVMDKPTQSSPQEYIDKYMILPGIAMYAAGQWIVNLNYWGCNQYITQRALGADLPTARRGILFAAFLKLLMPVIVMLPGIAAYVLYKNGHLNHLVGGMDGAYSAVLAFLPAGFKGLSLAALTAAIVASLAGKSNSISTIFTLDIYKKYFTKEASEQKLVRMGRWFVIIAMCISVLFTWDDILGIGGAGGFTFIQKYTGFISPGVLAVFLLGMFWKRTSGTAAVVGILSGFILSLFFNEFAPAVFGNETFLYTAFPDGHGAFKIPFLIAMGLSGVLTVILMVVVTLAGPKINPKAFAIDKTMFKLDKPTLILVVSILMILSALYIKFW